MYHTLFPSTMTQDIDAAISDTSSTLQGIGLADGGKKFGRELRKDFLFDEGHINLNHGRCQLSQPGLILPSFFHLWDLHNLCIIMLKIANT